MCFKKIMLSVFLMSMIATSVVFADNELVSIFDDLDNFMEKEGIGTSVQRQDYTSSISNVAENRVVLGNERLFTEYAYLIDGKKIGIVTNQTGVNSKGEPTVERLKYYTKGTLIAAYSPEHGLDGKAKAGAYVNSYIDTVLGIPVYSLYGKTREPSQEMLKNIDILLFDMQDIGSRTYTYMSTLNYVMRAGAKYNIPIVVLDRPNPIGGTIVEGHMAKDKYLTFVGVDNLPIAHGMTCGELAQFFNRKIHADITVIPMANYNRNMIWQDTGLPFVATSPNIPDLESAFLYMATGMGEGTGIGQANKFHWIGGKNIKSEEFAKRLNRASLPGVRFEAKSMGERGGVNVIITDYHTFNPAKTGIYALAIANELTTINIPVQKGKTIPMFEKLFGSSEMGNSLRKKQSAEEIVRSYQGELNEFKQIRKNYLIYPEMIK